MAEYYYHKTTGERLGEVLAKYESESTAGKWYQVRLADSDEVTYCTCRGWIAALNKTRHTGGEAVCTHIMKFRNERPDIPIVIMNFEQFASVRRGIPLKLNKKTVDDAVHVKRGGF